MKTLLLCVIIITLLAAAGCETTTYATFDNSPDTYVSLANSIYKKLDKNGDGFLSPQEQQKLDSRKFQRDFQREHQDFMKRFNEDSKAMQSSMQPPLISPRQFMGL